MQKKSDLRSMVLTADGSTTLRSARFQATFHSEHGAVQESKHIFIDLGLRSIIDSLRNEISILEFGFGTGLNALLTVLEIKKVGHRTIFYKTYENFPVEKSELSQLNYGHILEAETLFWDIHEAPWNSEIQITPLFHLHKKLCLFEELSEDDKFDIIFYDPFGPGVQPKFWEEPFLSDVVNTMKEGAVLVTYCSKGSFRRALRSLGLSVEKCQGPPGKREVTRATKGLISFV